MNIIKNELIVAFDCDETLIFHEPEHYLGAPTVTINYYGHEKKFAVHWEHVKLLKAYKKRGFYIRVWSNNGFRWAERVVRALELCDFVDSIETKPMKYVDDKKRADQVIGQHVYIPVSKTDD